MEQTPIYNAANFNWCGYAYGSQPPEDINRTVRNTVINAFLCPSDPNSGTARLCNYAASYGATTNRTYNDGNGQAIGASGVFTLWISYGLRDCTDGSSGTIAFAEALVGKPNVANAYRGNVPTGADTSNPPAANQAYASRNPAAVLAGLQKCADAMKANSNISDDKGRFWVHGSSNYTLFNTIQTPNDKQYPYNGCKLDCPNCGLDLAFSAAATSQHPGGVNAMMADGSVRFVKDTIARDVWWSLGTKDGGEVVSADSY